MQEDLADFEILKGETLISVERTNDTITFQTETTMYQLRHDQNCCESVSIEDIVGDLDDLVGSPILEAEEASSNETPEDKKENRGYEPDSQTWTFYKIATIKGAVTIRWWGTSNGYYSESVSFYRTPKFEQRIVDEFLGESKS